MSSFRAPQRRDLDLDHVQTVEEVLAEGLQLDQLLDVGVGGREDADVDLDRLGPSEAHEFLLLHDPQELGLGLEADGGDLVEEDGPLVGRLEQALLQGHGAGERALDVAEEVALEQVRREGAAVDRDEGGVGPVRVQVDGPGDQLLAGPALALEEDRAPGRGGRLDQLEDGLHGLALADDVGEAEALAELVLEADVLVLEALALEGLLEHEQEIVVLEGLLDVVEGADLHGRDGRLDRAVGGDDDDGRQRVDPLDPPQDLDPVHPRHEEVEQDDVEGLGRELLERLLARARDLDLVALRGQELGQDVVDDRLVVDDVDDAFAAHGSCPRARNGRLAGGPRGRPAG